MDMPNENMPVIQHEQVIPPKVVEAWECIICYEGGKRTGQITIACGHTICLGCYTCEVKRVASLGQELKCPYCRQTVRLTEGPSKEEQDKINNHIRVIQLDNHRLAGLQKQMEDIQKQIADRKVKVLKLATDTGADIAQVQAEVLLLHAPAMPAPPAIPQAQPAPQMAGVVVHMPRVPQPVPQMPPAHVPMDHPENGVRCPGCRTQRPVQDVRYRHVPMEDGEVHRLKRCERCLLIAKRAAIIRWNNGQ